MDDSKPQPTPMIFGLKLIVKGSVYIFDPSFYRSIIGSQQYILFLINKVCQVVRYP